MNNINSSDIIWMRKALELAKCGEFTTSPNPCVGCIIVKDGKVLGQGFHIKAGQGHAEVNALKNADEQGNDVTGSTVYVTLEPCSHFGRTPPCALTLVKRKVGRVVAAMLDPNPKVAGKGFKILQDAGIETAWGVLEEEAEKLNRDYLFRMRQGRSLVRLKLACSLDGKIALANGESKWITSPDARKDVQEFRARASAILTTSKTVLADDPSLNVRKSELNEDILNRYPLEQIRQPDLILLDSQEIVPLESNIFKEARRVIRVIKNPKNKIKKVQNSNLEDISSIDFLSKVDDEDLIPLLEKLATMDINSVWVEAGAVLSGSLLKQNLVDELIVYIAPKILGCDAKNMVALGGYQSLKDIPEFEIVSSQQIGSDVRLIMQRKIPAIK